MDNIIIRNVEENDLHSVAQLYKIFWGDEQYPEKMKAKFKELQNNNNYIFLCATVNGQAIGTLMGIICDELYGECRPFMVMEDLVVHDNFRKMKIGTNLLRTLEMIGKERGCCQILFMTEMNRTSTISFYESLGYNSKANVGFKKKL